MPWPIVSEYVTDLEQVDKRIYELLIAESVFTDYVGTYPPDTSDNPMPQIFAQTVRQGATTPCMVFRFVSEVPKTVNSGRKIMTKMQYQIGFVINQGSIANVYRPLGHLENMFQRDQLLTDNVLIGSKIVRGLNFKDELDGGKVVQIIGFQVEFMAYNNLYVLPPVFDKGFDNGFDEGFEV